MVWKTKKKVGEEGRRRSPLRWMGFSRAPVGFAGFTRCHTWLRGLFALAGTRRVRPEEVEGEWDGSDGGTSGEDDMMRMKMVR